MGDEVTLKQFVESTWFKGLSRGAMLLGIPALTALSGFVGYTLNGVQMEQDVLKLDIAEIRETQGDRAAVNDQFQAEITADVAGMKSAVFIVQTDVATIKGILQGMERRNQASLLTFPEP